MRSAHVFARVANADLPVAVSGDGPYIIDREGRRYLDASGGAAVSCLGHSNTVVREAIKQQVDTLAYAHTGFFTNEPMEKLADRLVELAPEGIERVYFVSGGSEATEASIKLARQYFLEKGETKRSNVIARWQSYHGNTLGALSAGGNKLRRQQFEPLLSTAMHHIDPCYYWRWGKEGETPEQYAIRAADALAAKIEELGPDTVAAFIVEPVVGATLGAVPAAPGYFKRIREICDRYGVLLILDEVMCGMGRTGTLFASEQEGIAPDIVCVAKGLGAGMQPIGAMLCTGDIHDTIAKGSGAFQHGHTYLGHAVACAASNAVLGEIMDRNLLENVRRMGDLLMSRLQERFGQHPNVGDIRGRGLFIGLEIVEDRETKEPFAPERKVAANVKAEGMRQGLMTYPMSGTVDGRKGDHVLLAPPYIIDETHVEEIVSKLGSVLDRVLDGGSKG